ncbi:hypothetical protein SAMN05443529_1124 [Desulfosporosinus hippei DSM 8344]|uniref:Uncharacterized protein n=1 Tax=Desulfosporosinus hippei DSM 8344 TaxID=1121419 RepID=A0A1G8BCZ1_9FIRM|nr:hypothetical protein SAMN05443529_1124 [Desulfosporosinus hippei DSM 8344]
MNSINVSSIIINILTTLFMFVWIAIAMINAKHWRTILIL